MAKVSGVHLVIGGTGFCGVHLVRRLLDDGKTVRVLSRKGRQGLSKWALRQLDGAEILRGDVLDKSVITNAVQGVHTVIHAASALKSRNSDDAAMMDIDYNLKASVQVAEVSGQAGVKRIVYFSSAGAVYGNSKNNAFREDGACHPISSYGTIKLASEHYVSLIAGRTQMDSLILRLSNPYGPGQWGDDGQGIAAVFLRKAMQNAPLTIFSDGQARRDYIYISDAIEAVHLLLTQNAKGVYNVGSGQSHSVLEIADAVERATGAATKRKEISARYKADVGVVEVSCEKLAALGFAPKVPLSEGMRRHYDWLSSDVMPD